MTPSASSSGIGSLESTDEILTLSTANSSTPIVVTSVRVKPSIGSDFSVKDYPVKVKLSDADARLIGATLAGSASDASQNNFPTVPQNIRIISSQQHHQVFIALKVLFVVNDHNLALHLRIFEAPKTAKISLSTSLQLVKFIKFV